MNHIRQNGEAAFFKVNKTGNFFMFISDAVAGASVNDSLIELTGVTAISSLNVTGGDWTILA